MARKFSDLLSAQEIAAFGDAGKTDERFETIISSQVLSAREASIRPISKKMIDLSDSSLAVVSQTVDNEGKKK